MADLQNDPATTVCYRPRRTTTWCVAAGLMMGALAVGRVPLAAASTAGTLVDLHMIGLSVLACASLVLGGRALANAVLGRPSLSVTAEGVRLDGLLSTRWAAWRSLGPFQVAAAQGALGRGTLLAARARIVGAEVSRSLRGRRQFMIADTFRTPIDTVVAEINARQPNVQGNGAAWHLGGMPYVEDNRVGIKTFTTPWVSFALLAILVAVFVMEQKYAIGPHGPLLRASVATLQALGAESGQAVLTQGEWYRLFTAPLLHANLTHLIGNGIALFMAGYVLENLAGRAWLVALFVLGGLGGAAMSMAMNPATLPCVGASGAIMALFAAGLISSFRMLPGPTRWLVQANFVGTVLTSIIPQAASAGTMRIDYGAHIGGALVGAACGLVLLCSWSVAARRPRFQTAAQGIGVAGVILAFTASVAVAARYPDYVARSPWIPSGLVPSTFAEMDLHGADLAARYPHDPRAHLFYGISLTRAHDYGTAEQEFETSLQETEQGGDTFGRRFDNTLWGMLAVVAADQGQWARAREVAQTACWARGVDRPATELVEWLRRERLCG
jgi:membrane associated rhomboid family serine protease